jgi:hypothetical protein
MKTKLLNIAVLLLCLALGAQKFQGVANTPPMGWNSWNFCAPKPRQRSRAAIFKIFVFMNFYKKNPTNEGS